MKIIITEHARNSLFEIFQYYRFVVNLKVAHQIVSTIKGSISKLNDNPGMGQIEPLLEELNLGHRRIISGNYKIIYRIADSIIYVTDIFDSRRNPEEMKL